MCAPKKYDPDWYKNVYAVLDAIKARKECSELGRPQEAAVLNCLINDLLEQLGYPRPDKVWSDVMKGASDAPN